MPPGHASALHCVAATLVQLALNIERLTRKTKSKTSKAHKKTSATQHKPGISSKHVESKSMSPSFIAPVLAKNYEDYRTTDKDISVVGSLKSHAAFWENIDTPDHLIHVIKQGYTIPLKTLPRRTFLCNNKSSIIRATFVREQIDDLLAKGAIEERASPQRIVNPLTVAIKNGKKRLVLDLRLINKKVYQQKCKIEGAETLAKYLPKAKFLYGFDLKAGYHHVDICPEQWELLGFAYTDHKEELRFFVFKVLPFGLTSAGFLFTKLLRVLIQHWRTQCLCIVAFFDDGLGAASDYEEAVRHSNMVFTDLVASGFVPNKDKCTWEPTETLAWLGMLYDLVQQKIFVEEAKLAKLEAFLADIAQHTLLHVRTLSSLIGSIISMLLVMLCKRMQMIVAGCDDWNSCVRLTKPAREEIRFWCAYARPNNGFPIGFAVASGAVSYSDASGTGCASLITPMPAQREIVVHRTFTEFEAKQSSTYRELLAVVQGLEETKHILHGQCLRWHTDSKNVVSIVRKGSMKPALLEMALRVFAITKEFRIALSVSWLQRELNGRADMYSRIIDYDDWGVHPAWFAHICRILGPVDCDRFADRNNTKCISFNSRFYCREATATDAFTQDWSTTRNWLVPPIYLIDRALQYLQLCRATGILVVPMWRSAYYWPTILRILEHQQSCIRGNLELANIYTQYGNQNTIFGSPQWRSKTLAIALDFTNML